MTRNEVTVRDLGDGDFEVVRGGDIYRRWNGSAVPGTVKAGDRCSAAEVCDWLDFGAVVKSATS